MSASPGVQKSDASFYVVWSVTATHLNVAMP